MEKEFLNCLRIQIVPDHFEEQRIKSIVDFCTRYGFKNVMLFINAEEYNVGHMTVKEAEPWVAAMKRAKKCFTENGLTVSLNPWIELGHLDRKRPLKPDQHFTTMVDFNGRVNGLCVCPFCSEWRAYFKDFYTYLLRELEPDTVWVEDDFRLHNHAPLEYGGCFCEEHMKRYNAKLGASYTREQFTDLLFRKKADMRVRRAWLDVNREGMVELAEFIGETVKAVGNAKVGLMSSGHDMHATEGRDWNGIHKGLAQGGVMIDRLHLTGYYENSPKEFYFNFNRVPYVCRALLPKGCKVLPEIENAAFSTFTKSPRFLQFQVEASIPLCIDGMTYDIFDFVGNGAIESFGYGQVIKQLEPYMNAVKRLSLDYGELDGIMCPVDEKSVYHRRGIRGFSDLIPDEHHFYAHLGAIGLTTKITKQKKFVGKTVALSNGAVYNFSKAQLTALFRDNFVILEGGAAAHLIDRGLGHLIRAESYELQTEGVNSYEQVNDEALINGIPGYRATMFDKAGVYTKINYTSEVNALSDVYDYKDRHVGIGGVYEKNFLLIPFVINDLYREQFNELRAVPLRQIALKQTNPTVCTGRSGIYAYHFKKKNKSVIILVNSTLDDLEQISLEVNGLDFVELRVLSRTSGRSNKCAFTKCGSTVTVAHALPAMTTCCMILK